MNVIRYYFIAAAFVFSLSVGLMSCSSDSPAITDPQEQPEELTEEATVFKPLILSSSQNRTRIGAEEFASRFLLSVIENEKDSRQNVMVSPLGMQVLLTMLSNGMDDYALNEVKDVLGSSVEELNDYYTFLIEKLPVVDNQVAFSMANSCWFDNRITIEDRFASVLDTRFHAESFSKPLSTEDTRKEINGWCSDKTKGKITEFLRQPLDLQCMMFLANAWYFNGKWTNMFDKKNTVEGIFTSSDGRKQSVEMMNAEMQACYSDLPDGGQIVSLAYGNGTFRLNIYLPAEGQELNEGVKKHMSDMNIGGSSTDCEISIPKFELEYRNEEVLDILSKMGISSIADKGHLDGIFKNALVDFIQQSTALAVAEDGATAAAVTGGGLFNADIDSEPSGPKKITVDRPFAFSITEATNDITLMSGVVRSMD